MTDGVNGANLGNTGQDRDRTLQGLLGIFAKSRHNGKENVAELEKVEQNQGDHS